MSHRPWQAGIQRWRTFPVAESRAAVAGLCPRSRHRRASRPVPAPPAMLFRTTASYRRRSRTSPGCEQPSTPVDRLAGMCFAPHAGCHGARREDIRAAVCLPTPGAEYSMRIECEHGKRQIARRAVLAPHASMVPAVIGNERVPVRRRSGGAIEAVNDNGLGLLQMAKSSAMSFTNAFSHHAPGLSGASRSARPARVWE